MFIVNWGGVNGKAFSMTVATPEERQEWQAILGYCKGKRNRASRGTGAEWNLNHWDVKTLLDEASITIFDVGQKKGMYQLGRHGDTGPYEIGNCRFITKEENLNEYCEGKRKPVKINGVVYPSYIAAEKVFSTVRQTLSRMKERGQTVLTVNRRNGNPPIVIEIL